MIFADLTAAEQQLMLLLVEGMTSDEIADTLGKSKKTIDHKIIELRKRTGHDSRIQLVGDYYRSTLCKDTIQDELNILDKKIAVCEAQLEVYRTMRQIKFNQWLKVQDAKNI
jgi:DNA-binding CsgD family transcriptional regulator